MRRTVPKPGTDWSKFITVIKGIPGTDHIIGRHRHRRWTVIYYLSESDPLIVNDSDSLDVSPGTIVCLAPLAYHACPQITKKRIIVAIQVDAET